MSDFVHLHLHSEYSLLDGACRIKDIPKRAKELGQKAVAITDHGNMFGVIEFYNACIKEGIKPIIGCEVYVAPNSRFDREKVNNRSYYHLVLLAKNEIGYKNLSKLVSVGYTEGFYTKPRVCLESLKEYGEGLIALSACLSGYIPRCILSADISGAENYIYQMQSIFGKDDFYLEVQNHGIDNEKTVTDELIKLSEKTGAKLVATNDVHYISKEDAGTQLILMSIQMGATVSDNSNIAFPTSEFYMKDYSEMAKCFPECPYACDESVKIAEKCNFTFDFSKTELPKYKVPEGISAREMLRNLAYEGFEKKISDSYIVFTEENSRDKYVCRIEYELSIIEKMGYSDYFLIVWDFINFAKNSKISVGPGRGSGAGSLVAFLLGITDVDSIKFDLLFERFLNIERVSMPDIDTDFCYERRDEVIEYVKKRYGEDHVAQIITFGTMASKAAIKDVGRVLEIPTSDVNLVSKLVDRMGNIRDSLNSNSELQKLYNNDEKIKQLIDTAINIEGMPRHASTHAAGVVITEKPLTDYLPVSVNGGIVVTQYDMNAVAELGLLKFDFLAIRYLTIISDTEKLIRCGKNKDFDISKIPLDDEKTYKLLSSGMTNGVFQLESSGIKQVLIQLQPKCLDDIIACIALYRPGPMDSIPKYIELKNSSKKPEYKSYMLEPILKSTYGCIVYQEQVMQICSNIAGYSYGHADIVRRAMAKKKAKEMEKERGTFISGAVKNGLSEQDAKDLFEDMASFANYAFNKSHAVAYGITSYRTAYLKARYPKEYYACLITSVLENVEKINQYIDECGKLGIKVLPPDVNFSNVDFSVEDNNIRYGLLALKNVGRIFVSSIVEEREKNGEYKSFDDFIYRLKDKDMNKRQIESLIKAGALDSFGIRRSQLMKVYEDAVDGAINISKTTANGQTDIFSILSTSAEFDSIPKIDFPDIPEFSQKELLMYEKEITGMYFSGKLLDSYNIHLSKIKPTPISAIISDEDNENYKDGDRVTVAGIITSQTVKQTKSKEKMAFVRLDDASGEIEVIIFPKAFQNAMPYIITDNVISVNGRLDIKDDDVPKIILTNVENVMQNSEYTENVQKLPTLYLKVQSVKSEIVMKITEMMKEYKGNTEVVFYDAQAKKYVKASGLSISVSNEIISVLKEILGDDAVVFKDQ